MCLGLLRGCDIGSQIAISRASCSIIPMGAWQKSRDAISAIGGGVDERTRRPDRGGPCDRRSTGTGGTGMSALDFGDRLAALCAFELSQARGTPERLSAMIERLVNSLSFTVSIAAGGDPGRINRLLEGARNYLDEAAADHAKIGAFLKEVKGR